MATTVDSILVRIDADLSDLRTELGKLDRRLEKTSKDTKRNLDAIGGAFRSLGPIIAGALGGVAIKSIVDVARRSENLQIQLGYLFGDVEEGARAFQVMSEYASQVPFSLAQIEAASKPLGAVAKDADELQQLLKLTGDVAAVTGLSFQDTALQLQRSFSAGIGAADMFRDAGVSAMLGFQQGASYSVSETIAKFEEAFGEGGQFHGAAADMADTFDGTMSMLGDSLFNFQKQIGEAGFFDALKEEVKGFDTAIKENDQTVRRFAQNLGEILAVTVRFTADAMASITGFFNEFFDFARGLGHAIATEDSLDVLNFTVDELIERGRSLHSTQNDIAKTGELAAAAIEEQASAAGIAGKSLNDLSAAASGTNKEYDKLIEKIQKLSNQAAVDALTLEGGDQQEADFQKFLGTKANTLTPDDIGNLRSQFDFLYKTQQQLDDLKTAEKMLKQKDASEKLREEIALLESYQLQMGESTLGVDQKLQELNKELELQDPMMRSVVDAYEDAGKAIADSLASAFENGRLSMEAFKDISKQLISTIISNFLRLAIINPIINSMFGLTGQNALATSPRFSFGGGSAGGGQMHPSMPRLVGERGPELFVPHSAGTLMNNMNTQNALGGQAVNVTQNLNFSLGVSDTVKAEIAGMMPIINQSAVSAVQQARSRGGSFAGAFGG